MLNYFFKYTLKLLFYRRMEKEAKIKGLRDSNIEMLRCILMWFVVIIHFVGHNILYKESPVQFGSQNYFSSNALLSISVCAVDCFVIISGYFSIKFSLKKILIFVFSILFYEFFISCIYYLFTGHCTIPHLSYWFVRQYLALMILSPILNAGLRNLDERTLRMILLLSIFFFILPLSSPSYNSGKNVYIFILLYSVGFYLRNYLKHKIPFYICIIIYLVLSILILFETMVLHKLGLNAGVDTLSYSYDNILIVLSAIFLFLAFANITFNSKLVNNIAKSSFFVYIIHENPNLSSGENSIYKILEVASWNDSVYFVIYILIMTQLVFFVCIFIDKLRLTLFGNFDYLGSMIECRLLNIFHQ